MKSFRTLWSAAALCAAASPAFAGSVYVPLAINDEVGDVRLRTQVSVANHGAAAGRVETFFIPTDVDGTLRPAGNRPTPLQLAAGATQVLPPVADGAAGLLEISGGEGLVVSARLLGGRHGSEMPVITSRNLVAPGATAHLQALMRDGNRITGYGLVNLAQAPAQCTVRVFRSTGQPVGAAAVVTLPPLSHRQFVDPLAPEDNLSSARATATCNQAFYAYVNTVDLTAGDVAFAGPGEPASSTLRRPGEGPAVPQCGAGVDCFEQLGAIFTPTRPTLTRVIVLPFAKGVDYKKARAQVDVTHGGWYGRLPDGVHQLLTLARGDNETRLGYVAARGPSRNFVVMIHNLGRPGEGGNRLTQNFALQPGQTYHVDYTYDPANHRAELVITNNGAEVIRISDNTTFVNRIRSDGEDFFVQFGLDAPPPHAPSLGWTYSNLKVEFFR
jgi:hypothetical protein